MIEEVYCNPLRDLRFEVAEAYAMWIIFSIFAILWFLGIHLYFPGGVTFLFFGAMLVTAVLAVWKPQSEQVARRSR
jgi:hypothetical protein